MVFLTHCAVNGSGVGGDASRRVSATPSGEGGSNWWRLGSTLSGEGDRCSLSSRKHIYKVNE